MRLGSIDRVPANLTSDEFDQVASGSSSHRRNTTAGSPVNDEANVENVVNGKSVGETAHEDGQNVAGSFDHEIEFKQEEG
jgi:hypothetical protein